MENRFKLKLSNMFRSSFGSCRTRHISDVIDKAVFLPQAQQEDLPPPKSVARPFPSICRPKCSDHPKQPITINNCVISSKDVTLPRRKIFERCSPFDEHLNPDGHICPPASPFLPLNPFYDHHENSFKPRKNRDKKTKKKTSNTKKNKAAFFPFSSSSLDSSNYSGWWSSSDYDDNEREDETDTLFTSKSHSSDSSGPRLRRRSRRNGSRRRANSELGLLPLQGRVKDSFAVVKRSSDPYNDFRTSMVEMIIEKQIFSAKDLEQLLQCFLSLNSSHHHRVILKVFTEIWEALFSNWGS